MSAFISPIHQLVQSSIGSRREEMRVVQQKADDAIRKLRDTGDSEVAEILLAHYEKLRKRSIKFSTEFPKCEETSTSTPEESADNPKQTDSQAFEIDLDHLEDGSLKFTLPPEETEEKPKTYILSSPNFDKKSPVHNIIIIAEEMVNTAIHYIDKLQKLAESEMDYLIVMCESLTSQKQKIGLLEKAEGSPVALEVAPQLYLNDAFKFLQSVQMMVNDVDRDVLDERAEDDSVESSSEEREKKEKAAHDSRT